MSGDPVKRLVVDGGGLDRRRISEDLKLETGDKLFLIPFMPFKRLVNPSGTVSVEYAFQELLEGAWHVKKT